MKESVNLVLRELDDTLSLLDETQFMNLVTQMKQSRRVVVVGVGRVMLSLKAWVKRFKHLGIDINYFGSETEASVGPLDLVIVASSSGETIIPKVISAKARELGAKVFYIGCTPDSTVGKIANYHLILQGQTKLKLETEYKSKQPMSTLIEQQIYLLGDILTAYMMRTEGIKETVVIQRHANLE
ncbi:MAG: sugar isomerase [Erysipelothrix sp.]|nr:sugar isomerase [Erysipelothrix sp.]